jgi:S-DNA-T family DNA segregation ATPase FtsK/SpoIIIE
MSITGIFIDEVQVPLEERTPIKVQGKTIPA